MAEILLLSRVPVRIIESKILLIRGKRVMLDRDLAKLYGIKAIKLREQVKRNTKRFPADFMFQLTKEEAYVMVSQNAIPSKRSLGGYLPYAFTEHGILMLSSILNSEKAIEVNITIMRVFVRLKEMIIANKDLELKMKELEHKLESHEVDIHSIFEAIRELMSPPPVPPKPKIGFHT